MIYRRIDILWGECRDIVIESHRDKWIAKTAKIVFNMATNFVYTVMHGNAAFDVQNVLASQVQ